MRYRLSLACFIKTGSFCTVQTKDSDLFERQIPFVQKGFLVKKFQIREKAMFYRKLDVDCQKIIKTGRRVA